MAVKIIIRFRCEKKHPSLEESHFPYCFTWAQDQNIVFLTTKSQTSDHFMKPKRAPNPQVESEMQKSLDGNDTKGVRYKTEPCSMRRIKGK